MQKINSFNLFEEEINQKFLTIKKYIQKFLIAKKIKIKNLKLNILTFNYLYLNLLCQENLKDEAFINNFLFINNFYFKIIRLKKIKISLESKNNHQDEKIWNNYEETIIKNYFCQNKLDFKENQDLIYCYANFFKFKNKNFAYFAVLLLIYLFLNLKKSKLSLENVKNKLYCTFKLNSIIRNNDYLNFNFWIKKNQSFYKKEN